MTDFPDLKLKTLVSFPATIIDGIGIDTVKANGSYQFNLAYDDFAPPVSSVTDPTNQNALIWNSITGQYALVPISTLVAGSLTPSNASPIMDGVAAPGVATVYTRGDHVHPTDTSRAPNTFLQAGAGAVTRTPQNKDRDIFHVKDFGAVGDGSTDDTTAIQNAINAAVSAGGEAVVLSAGTFKITSTITITAGVQLRGAGRQKSTIAPATYIKAFSINTANSVLFRDFGIQYSGTATSGAVGIEIITTEDVGSRIENLFISGAYVGIDIQTASYWVIDGTLVQASVSVGIKVNNAPTPDSGDTVIAGCTILGNVSGTTFGIQYLGGGGLKIENNKINQVTYGIYMAYGGTATASDLIVLGNSIEGTTMVTGVYLSRATTTGTWLNVQINNNQFLIGNASGVGVLVPLDATGAWISNLMVSNNMFYLSTGNPVGIDIASASGVSSLGNHFQSSSATTVCQATRASVTLAVVGLNSKYGSFAASIGLGTGITTVAPF